MDKYKYEKPEINMDSGVAASLSRMRREEEEKQRIKDELQHKLVESSIDTNKAIIEANKLNIKNSISNKQFSVINIVIGAINVLLIIYQIISSLL